MAHVEMFFDLSSPYSYLASTQVEQVARRAGATFEAKPFVLGVVFQATGNRLPAAVAAKAAWMLNDLRAWARDYAVPFRLNDCFPFNAMKAHRLILAVEEAARWRVIQRCFRAFWSENADLADDAVLARLLRECGLEAEKLLPRVEEADIKLALRANTDDAIARGAFGAPTFFVGGELFVGNDRLPFVERAARGERVYRE